MPLACAIWGIGLLSYISCIASMVGQRVLPTRAKRHRSCAVGGDCRGAVSRIYPRLASQNLIADLRSDFSSCLAFMKSAARLRSPAREAAYWGGPAAANSLPARLFVTHSGHGAGQVRGTRNMEYQPVRVSNSLRLD